MPTPESPDIEPAPTPPTGGMLAQILRQKTMPPVASPFTVAVEPEPEPGVTPQPPLRPRVSPRRPRAQQALEEFTGAPTESVPTVAPAPASLSATEAQLRQQIVKLLADNNQMSALLAQQARLLHGPGGRWASAKLVAESVGAAQDALRTELLGGMQHILSEVASQRRDTEDLALARAQVADLANQLEAEQTRAAAAEALVQERTTNNASLKRTLATVRAELDTARRAVAELPALRDILSLQTLVLAQSGDAVAKAKVDSALTDLRQVIARIEAQLPAPPTP